MCSHVKVFRIPFSKVVLDKIRSGIVFITPVLMVTLLRDLVFFPQHMNSMGSKTLSPGT